MVELIHPPDPHALLPPLLACLPTAFASSRPPPALLDLLSPILKQRLSYISSSDNWLKLLCWDKEKAEPLWEQVENATFEPHPSSGEIEVGDVDSIKFKRLDEETLQAQIALADWPFTPSFLWCTGSQAGHGWKLAQLLPEPELDDSWSPSIQQANGSAKERIMSEALREAEASSSKQPHNARLDVPKEEDDYWAQYDQSPGPTAMRKPSVPMDQQKMSEADYFARYGDVQPAMDNHDPDEAMQNGEQVQSTLNGHAQDYQQLLSQQATSTSNTLPTDHSPPPYQAPSPDHDMDDHDAKTTEVAQPHPSSPSSRGGGDAVARLEDAAERYNESEVGIRQHISTSIKSMYRLAKSVGMERDEFEGLVGREVEGLRVLDLDD